MAAGVRRVWPGAWQVMAGADEWQTLHPAVAQDGGGQTADDEPGPGS
ncbi:hypothetical protein [Nonomuraea sp. KM90]